MTNSSIDATAAAEHFLAGARDGGLRHVCISPGSRSTPLAVAALRTPGITTSIHLDERVGAFNALGRALASSTPVGLICTSGTAAANFLPAVSEAAMSNVGLIVMTADRPPEHQSWGVGQTFDQRGLYHRQVRTEITMPVGGDGGANFSHRAGWRAASEAIEEHGPIHVNWPFRLPVEPQDGPISAPPPLTEVTRSAKSANPSEVSSLRQALLDARSPLIIAGPATLPSASTTDAERLINAGARAGAPVLADALSGLRGVGGPALVPSPALLFGKGSPFATALSADLIIHLGQTPTAKATRLWWETQRATHVLIDPLNEWNDPSHLATHRYVSPAVELLEAATEALDQPQTHLDTWVSAGEKAAAAMQQTLTETSNLTEAAIAHAIGTTATGNDVIVASSSMPVRDIDMFVDISCPARVFANRGINGIDGVIATAAGITNARAATDNGGRTVVLIGDVALLHDVGGLLDAARHETPMTIVVPNNDGGGIFSMLPAKDALDAAVFDELLQTPHGTTFEFLASHPGITHTFATDIEAALAEAHTSPQTPITIIECSVSIEDRFSLQHAYTEVLAST